jgi:hypothetical protein
MRTIGMNPNSTRMGMIVHIAAQMGAPVQDEDFSVRVRQDASYNRSS